MSRATLSMREFASCLVDYETRRAQTSETKTLVAFHVCEKLRPHLATLMGSTGFAALLTHSLTLAGAEVPWLRPVRVDPGASLQGLDDLETPVDPKRFAEGEVVLLAQLLGLLVAFIGERLTLQIAREIWPQLPLSDLGFPNRDENDKTN